MFAINTINNDEYEQIQPGGDFDKVLFNIEQFHLIRKTHYPFSKCRTRVNGVTMDPNFNEVEFKKFWESKADNVVCAQALQRWDSYKNMPATENSLPSCPLLWERMYVWYDGTVNPCDYDYKSLLQTGNVNQSSLEEIWQGAAYEQLRGNHLAHNRNRHVPCDRCEYYG